MTPTQFGRWLGARTSVATRNVADALNESGEILRSGIMANASGRPGPRVRTGDYRRSWSVRPVAGRLAVRVGTNAPQARRLEFGFNGVDSLGRRYAQPPYAHVEPAVRQYEAQIVRRIADAVGEAFE